MCLCPLPNSGTLSSHKQPSDTVASRALLVTRRPVTCASRAFLPICLIQSADDDGPACFPVRRLAAELIDAQGTVDWRAASGASSRWNLFAAHADSLLRDSVFHVSPRKARDELAPINPDYSRKWNGTISALFGLSHGVIDQAQYSYLVAIVIGSAVIPTDVCERLVLAKAPTTQRRS